MGPTIVPDLTRPVRIAVLSTHPIQYFAPLYAYLNAAPDLDVTALYLSDISLRGARDEGFDQGVKWDVDLLQGYRSIFLGAAASRRKVGGFWSLVAPQVWSELRSGHYDILWLHGHNYAANFIALAAAKTAKLHVFMRGETHLGLQRPAIKEILRRPLLGALYGACDRLLAIGSANAAFYRAMGVPDHKIVPMPYTVDNARFMQAAHLTHNERMAVRRRYGVPTDRPAILYAAKFTARKRPVDLLHAARTLRQRTDRAFAVVMAGSGELERYLRSFCVENDLDNVVFSGFVNQSELPGLYAACDIFVLSSEQEPWGLAINEAMCAALPVVATRVVGCIPDLVENEVNGFALEVGDVDGLAAALLRLIEDQPLRSRMGQAGFARISHWGYRECLEGIRSALADLPRVEALRRVV